VTHAYIVDKYTFIKSDYNSYRWPEYCAVSGFEYDEKGKLDIIYGCENNHINTK
jgi:hypothetical protein